MIATIDEHGRRSFLILSSRKACSAFTGGPLEASNRSSFPGVLVRDEGFGWLMETPFFRSNGHLQIRRKIFSKRRWHGRIKTKSFLFFSLIKLELENPRTPTLDLMLQRASSSSFSHTRMPTPLSQISHTLFEIFSHQI